MGKLRRPTALKMFSPGQAGQERLEGQHVATGEAADTKPPVLAAFSKEFGEAGTVWRKGEVI